MKKDLLFSVFSGLVTMSCSTTLAGTPLGGLAVAVSPVGDVLVAGGDSRTLLISNSAKMEITNRLWLGVTMVALNFNKDGSKLLVEDTDGTLYLVDAKTWKVVKSEKKISLMSVSQKADLVAGLDGDYNDPKVKFLSASDFSLKGTAALEKGKRVSSLGLNAAGTRLAVLFEAVTDDAEPNVTTTPPDLKGLDAEEFKLKNDGKTSRLVVFEVPSGKKITDNKLYYSPSGTGSKIYFDGDSAMLVNYGNLNATVTPEGTITLFKLRSSYNYGLGASADQKVILAGGLSSGTYINVDGMKQTTFDPDKIGGWPEYFKSFAVAADGTAYGSTSAYRVIRIKPDGSFDKSFPIY